jgi:ABC-type lipoprotein export system ATPase subunit
MVTHDPRAAERAKRVLKLSQGTIAVDGRSQEASSPILTVRRDPRTSKRA